MKIKGFCPMGCGDTLIVAAEGYVTCGYLPCPEPDAVSTILEDRESEHIVTISAVSTRGRTEFTIRHPLRERLRDELQSCGLHEYMSTLPGPPASPGVWRVVADTSGRGGYWFASLNGAGGS